MSPLIGGEYISYNDYVAYLKAKKQTKAKKAKETPVPQNTRIVVEDNIIHSNSQKVLVQIEDYLDTKYPEERLEPTLSHGMWLDYMIVIADLTPPQRSEFMQWLRDHYEVEEC